MNKCNISVTAKVECFVEPPKFVIQIAKDIRSALEFYCAGDIEEARRLFSHSDKIEVEQYQANVNEIKLRRAAVFKKQVKVVKGKKKEQRMPKESERIAIFERDHWHCRFCGNPVIYKEVIKYFSKKNLGLRWGRTNKEKHRGVSPLFAVADHLIVHSLGGKNTPDNIVTACGPCNYSRGNLTLEQVGLLNPLERPPKVTIKGWDGLRGLLREAKVKAK